jgi:hypothetical protein
MALGVMLSIGALAALFDHVLNGWRAPYDRPTASSIAKINAHFDCVLPKPFVLFAQKSTQFSSWFSALGRNFESADHIVRINSLYRKKRQRRNGQWVYAKPRNLVIINLGFDADCDCLDLDAFDPETGEYQIRYWSPGVAESAAAAAPSFEAYILKHIASWAPKSGEKKRAYDALVNKLQSEDSVDNCN